MKRFTLSPPTLDQSAQRPIRSARSGATLSEALVALLVMAIGVISLASLFPIAVLKTARANQLTCATDIRYNAEAMMKVYPWIFSDPNPVDTGGPAGIPDGLPFNDYDFSAGRAFLFDPQGCVGTPYRPAPLPGAPGNPAPLPAGMGLIPRFGGGFSSSLAAADKICSGLDTWSTLHDATVSNFNTALTQMDMDSLDISKLPPVQVAADATPVSGGTEMRVQIFYNGGKSSLTRMVTGFTGTGTVVWTEDINSNSTLDAGEDQNGNQVIDLHALPGGITYETARLESRERRYTWLLTVRPQDIGASFTGGLGAKPSFDVTVVVYFGRSFSLQDEQVYGTVPAGLPAVPNLATGSTVVNFNEGQTDFTLTWASSDTTPTLKRGGWILDAQNGYWYQIDNYSETTGATSSVVRLTSTILETSTLIVAPRGVVDVFPIPPQTP